MVPCAADMELVLRIIGFFGIIVGAILFRDKSGRGSGKRIIQIFTVIGGSIGYLASTGLLAIDQFELMIDEIAGDLDPLVIQILFTLLGAYVARSWARMAHRAVVILGPPWAILMFIDYLEYQKGVDLMGLAQKIPNFPNISAGALEGLLLILITTVSIYSRRMMRRYAPLVISGIVSGFMITYGVVFLLTGERPEPGGPEVWGVLLIATCSIAMQIRYISKAEEKRILRDLYSTDEELRDLKQKASEAKKKVIKGFGDTLDVVCPACSMRSAHKVITRKQGPKGTELLLNCRWVNEWEEWCNNHHPVIEVEAASGYHT